MKYSALFALLFCLVCPAAVFAENSVDELFEDPAPDTVADPDSKLTQDSLTKENIRFFESVRAEGYFLTGWTREHPKPKHSPYNALNFSFGTDARLDKNIRAYASFFITYPSFRDGTSDNITNPYQDLLPTDPTLSFSNVDVKEMFLDYTLGDLVFIRVGREALTWGQGRIFNPANFVGALAKGIGLKATTTFLGLDVSLVAMKNDGYFKLETDSIVDKAGIDTLGWSAKAEGSWLFFTGGVSGFHHPNLGDKGEGYLKTSLAGFDLFGEALIERKLVDSKPAGAPIPTAVFGVYRELGPGSNPWLQAQVETMVSARGESSAARSIPEVARGWDSLSLGIGATSGLLNFLKTKPSVSWLHSFQDRSGQLIFGFSNTTFPHIDLTAGVVWVYGPEDGRYVTGNPDPLNRRLILSFRAIFAFDINS